VIAKGYISSRTFMGERVPQSVQNLVLRNYCKNNNLVFELSSTEYAMNESFYILNQLLINKKYKSIIFYSLFQLPENNILRYEILTKFLKKNKKLIFVLENITASKLHDIQDIENIWHIKKISKICLSTQEIKKFI
jgi:sporadic carbohydrate cluster protein (TIGR04323 family)|tara:strand:+ start:2032 stop:2439 length:408 start_codon:yes stop_codon:yes gene_type:complete